MSDRYQGFVSTSIGQLFVKNLGLPNPTELERWTDGAPLVDGVVVLGGTGRLAEVLPTTLDGLGIASTTDARRRRPGQGARLRRHRHRPTPPGLVALQEFFTPLMRRLETCPRVVVHRHAAGADVRLRAGRPARARGLHPLARQGDRPRRRRPARVRRPGRRRRDQLDPRLPPLPQVGLRLRPGRPHRRPRLDRDRPGRRLDPARWPARSPSSPAPAAASARRSPGCCTATARPSSASTCRRPPASSRPS